MNEANFISFRVFADKRGDIQTELSWVPPVELSKLTKMEESDVVLLSKIIRETKKRLENIHEELEDELSSYS